MRRRYAITGLVYLLSAAACQRAASTALPDFDCFGGLQTSDTATLILTMQRAAGATGPVHFAATTADGSLPDASTDMQPPASAAVLPIAVSPTVTAGSHPVVVTASVGGKTKAKTCPLNLPLPAMPISVEPSTLLLVAVSGATGSTPTPVTFRVAPYLADGALSVGPATSRSAQRFKCPDVLAGTTATCEAYANPGIEIGSSPVVVVVSTPFAFEAVDFTVTVVSGPTGATAPTG